jgi:phosphatidylinositol 3-kinase
MVLVLAALYTCYNNYQQSQQEQQQRQGGGTGTDELEVASFQHLAATGLLPSPSSRSSNSNRSIVTSSSSSHFYRYRTMEEPVFRDSVREEWMLASFGPGGGSASRSGSPAHTGNSNIKAGVCVSGGGTCSTITRTLRRRRLSESAARDQPASIGSGSHDDSSNNSASTGSDKLGMTLANVSVGLYVHHVVAGGEASLVGIPSGAILVRVNQHPVVAEPTKAVLERVWLSESQQQHHQQQGVALASAADTAATGTVLEFWHNSQSYHAVFLSQQWGIAWAPAVQCCSVKRVYAQAARVGVVRGSWLLAVNRVPVSSLEQARQALADADVLELSLGFSPSAREQPPAGADLDEKQYLAQSPAHHHRHKGGASGSGEILARRSLDGVHVKFHSLDTAISGLCHHISTTNLLGASTTGSGDIEIPSSPSQYSASYWVHHVSIGQVVLESPPRNATQLAKSSVNVGQATAADFLQAWDPMESLLFGLRLHAVDYQADAMLQMLPSFVSGTDSARAVDAYNQDQDSQGVLSSSSTDAATWMKQLVSRPLPAGMTAADLVGAFLLQFLGIICGTPSLSATPSVDEKKEDFPPSDSAIASKRASWAAQQEVTSILLRVSRKDQGFCQRLYFLLRSFLSTLESTAGPSTTSVSTTALLALLNCLDRLRFAEGRSSRYFSGLSSSRRGTGSAPNSHKGSPAGSRVSNGASPGSVERKSGVLISTVEPLNTATLLPPYPDYRPIKKKGLFDLFRKKVSRNTSSQASTSVVGSSLVSTRNESIPPPPSPEKSLSSASALSPRKLNRSQDSALPSSPKPTALAPPTSPVTMYENMCSFLTELDVICSNIETSLQKSFHQKMADWALQPWSPSKDSALWRVTQSMREHLRRCFADPGDEDEAGKKLLLLVNPIDSSELLSSVECDECYVLPSAHFPILMTFNVSEQRCGDDLEGEELLYRTKVELLSIKARVKQPGHFSVQASIAGTISETTHPSHSMRSDEDGDLLFLYHIWPIGGVLSYETRSSWGAPQTLSLRVTQSIGSESQVLGYGWVDLSEQYSHSCGNILGGISTVTRTTEICPLRAFDDHGEVVPCNDASQDSHQRVELQLKITTESVGIAESPRKKGLRTARKRMLLYKHDDDLRQETFAVQFVKTCDAMLKASGLNLNLLTFQAVPVGTRRGFVEWIPGSVALSELCEPGAGAVSSEPTKRSSSEDASSVSLHSKAGLGKYESLWRLGDKQNGSLRKEPGGGAAGDLSYNPIQDYLRSVAYDPDGPYLIRKEVMDAYVKSCAGYSVITYILGVGDRHLDNLLLHQSGCFFHCDYSFILGCDPKANLPVRITDDMVSGMGGKDSDNYARFASMAGAAFLTLRRPENVRLLLSLVRLMEHSRIPDISENQSIGKSLRGMRDRFRLDLNDQEAVAFMECLVESAQSSKMAMAVDAIHSLGKKF